jgi:hypothetical protein
MAEPNTAEVDVIRRYEVFPLLLTALAVIGVWMFLFLGKPLIAHLGTELFTLTYEFLLMIVIGSGVSVLFQTVSHGREVRDRHRVLQRELHQELVSGYNDAKRARRLLRARGRAANGAAHPALGMNAAEYDRQLEALSSAQLSIELAVRRIEMNRSLFPRHADLLRALTTVGKYLNSIIDEWEEIRPTLTKSRTPLLMTSLPELHAFIQHYADSPRFREGFKNPFDQALRLLEQALASDR